MSVGVTWMDIWGDCGLVGLGVEEVSISTIGKMIFGGGGLMAHS